MRCERWRLCLLLPLLLLLCAFANVPSAVEALETNVQDAPPEIPKVFADTAAPPKPSPLPLLSPLPPSAEVAASTDESTADNHKTYWQAFVASFTVILISEIGDKTFLIAAILAMKHNRITIFCGGASALVLMTVLSAALGHLVPNLLPRTYTQIMAGLLFLVFGLKMLKDGYEMDADEGQKEMEEVQQELNEQEGRRKKTEDFELKHLEEGYTVNDSNDAEQDGHGAGAKNRTPWQALENLAMFLFSPMFVQTFVLTFLAEWGDRSQIATIALAAADDMYAVMAGASIAHCLCTGAAVLGGRLLASKISVRTVTLLGGILFLVFAVTTLLLREAEEAT